MNHSLNIHSGTTLLCVALRHKGDKAKIEKATLLCLKHMYTLYQLFFIIVLLLYQSIVSLCVQQHWDTVLFIYHYYYSNSKMSNLRNYCTCKALNCLYYLTAHGV